MKPDRSALAPIEQFCRLSTCVVASAIESFRVRLPNTGFVDSIIRCMFEDLSPIAGYAVTARIQSSAPPMEGGTYHYERADWWRYILSVPAPRVVVLQDIDDPPGLGAFVGEVNANILLALECVGLVTNGAARDLTEVRSLGFPMFAGNVSVSHAYAHIVDFGGPIVVGGLEVHPSDLIHADRHGVQTVPINVAAQVPAAAREILQRRERIVTLCRSAGFSVEKLRDTIQELGQNS